MYVRWYGVTGAPHYDIHKRHDEHCISRTTWQEALRNLMVDALHYAARAYGTAIMKDRTHSVMD